MSSKQLESADIQRYENFFSIIRKYIDDTRKRRQRGVNDYNVFTSLLPANDEVRLHSRFLYSLLDPNGLHYQGTLFLEAFISCLEFPGLDLNWEAAVVKKEYKNIDLYISDGVKHIIIENKIYAADQDRQIARYIEMIESELEKGAEIYVVYLSLGRDKPSKASLGKLEVVEKDSPLSTYLQDSEQSQRAYPFKSISYKKEVKGWLESILDEVRNLTNLSVVVSQYKDVINEICGQKERKLVSIKDYFDGISKENYTDILNQVDTLQSETRGDFINELIHQFQEKGFGRLIKSNQSCADYCIGDGRILMRFVIPAPNISNSQEWKCKCQIFKYDEEKGKESTSLDIREKEKLKKLIRPIGFDGGWSNCPGVLDMGEVNFQMRKDLLEKATNLYEELMAAITDESVD